MAYTMNGFSYPGDSPIKGKKKIAEKAAASAAKNEAMANISASMQTEFTGSDLTQGTNVQYGQLPNPINKKAPLRSKIEPMPVLEAKNLEVNLPTDPRPQPQQSNTTNLGIEKQSLLQKLGSGAGKVASSKFGQTVLTEVAKGLTTLAITSIGSKKKKPVRRSTGSAHAFSQIKIGRS